MRSAIPMVNARTRPVSRELVQLECPGAWLAQHRGEGLIWAFNDQGHLSRP